jgi:hypothetical protein
MTDIKDELAHYKKIFGTGDIATRSYIAMVKILEQQVNFLNSYDIKNNITSDEKKDTVTYKNAKDLWEGMPDTVLKLNKMKNELGIIYVEKEEEIQSINAKAIANGQD